jgi:hypothetical protein
MASIAMRIIALGYWGMVLLVFPGSRLFLGFAHDQRKALVDVTAVGAKPMRQAGLAALGTRNPRHALEGVMGPAHAFLGLGCFAKRKHASPQKNLSLPRNL